MGGSDELPLVPPTHPLSKVFTAKRQYRRFEASRARLIGPHRLPDRQLDSGPDPAKQSGRGSSAFPAEKAAPEPASSHWNDRHQCAFDYPFNAGPECSHRTIRGQPVYTVVLRARKREVTLLHGGRPETALRCCYCVVFRSETIRQKAELCGRHVYSISKNAI